MCSQCLSPASEVCGTGGHIPAALEADGPGGGREEVTASVPPGPAQQAEATQTQPRSCRQCHRLEGSEGGSISTASRATAESKGKGSKGPGRMTWAGGRAWEGGFEFGSCRAAGVPGKERCESRATRDLGRVRIRQSERHRDGRPGLPSPSAATRLGP